MQPNDVTMFSKACQYGIKATLHIAEQSSQGRRVSLKGIAKAIDSPEAFTAKILQLLAKNRIVNSIKGPSGGFEIAESDLDNVKLIQIVTAIDGDQIFNGCGLGLKKCDENNPCPVHEKFKTVRDDLKNMLATTNIRELAAGLNAGNTFLRV